MEEETCNDDETEHVPEVIAFFAFQRSSAHKIRARMQAPAAVPPVSEAVVCENEVTGPGSVCCGDMTNQACLDCWGRQGRTPPTGTTCTERATTTFATMNDLIQQGKVRTVGVSRFEGWRLSRTISICQDHHLAQPVCHQLCYSILDRRIEDEIIPFCQQQSISVTVFATTAIGLLSGRYRYGQPPPAGTSWQRGPYNYRRAMTRPVDEVIQVVTDIAASHKRTPSQIAMAWCLAQPGITSVITGADSPKRVHENCAAVEINLLPEELERLDRISEGQRLEIHKDCPSGYTA